MDVNKRAAFLLTIWVMTVFTVLYLAACRSGDAVTTSVQPGYEVLWNIDIGLDGFEIVSAKHELVWSGQDVRLTVSQSPITRSRMVVNNFQARKEKGRTYYFRELLIAYDGTKSPDSKGFDIQGTIPYGSEMQWETDKYLYGLQVESFKENDSSFNKKLVSIRTSRLIEMNFYQTFSNFKLAMHSWRVDLNSDFAEIKLCFYPEAFGEQLFQDFVADTAVTPFESENGVYYSKYERSEFSDSEWMTLIWKTDKGVFQIFLASRNEKGSDFLSSIDMDFIRQISAQIDAQPMMSD